MAPLIGIGQVEHRIDMDHTDQPSCPLCGDCLSDSDVKFPLKCRTSSCSYNMCYSCIHSMSTSCKEQQTASDGNKFTVKLSCPNCRGDYRVNITDVIFLRRAEDVAMLSGIADAELSAAELREKYTWDKDLLTQLNLAEKNYNSKLSTKEKRRSMIWTTSFATGGFNHEVTSYDNGMDVDVHLFSGLEHCMTSDEQEYVNELMTSGSTSKLAQAAQVLASIKQMNQDKITQKIAPEPESKSPYASQDKSNGMADIRRTYSSSNLRQRSGSLDSRQRTNSLEINVRKVQSMRHPRHDIHRHSTPYQFTHNDSDLSTTSNYSVSSTYSKARNMTPDEIEYGRRQHLKKVYPLPVRMPNSFTLSLNFDPYALFINTPVTFANDDTTLSEFQNNDSNNISGIVKDAYMRLSVGIWNNVKKGKIENQPGVDRIVGDGTNVTRNSRSKRRSIATRPSSPLHISPTRRPRIPTTRVVVSSVKGELSRLGLRVGDVVTHIDGEPFVGSAGMLRDVLCEAKDSHSSPDEVPTVEIVVNAEVGTAEALRLRRLRIQQVVF